MTAIITKGLEDKMERMSEVDFLRVIVSISPHYDILDGLEKLNTRKRNAVLEQRYRTMASEVFEYLATQGVVPYKGINFA